MSEVALSKIETEIKELNDEFTQCKEAKPLGEACSDLFEFVEKEKEPFTANFGETNPWHSNPKGSGGCTIC